MCPHYRVIFLPEHLGSLTSVVTVSVHTFPGLDSFVGTPGIGGARRTSRSAALNPGSPRLREVPGRPQPQPQTGVRGGTTVRAGRRASDVCSARADARQTATRE